MPFSLQFKRQIKHWILAGLLGCLSGMAIAETPVRTTVETTIETVYVIDRLLVGIYKGKKQAGAALKVLPTGAALEVLARDDGLARVRTADGIVGWVDANYLMQEKPAQILLLELEAVHERTRERLREAEFKVLELEAENRIRDLSGGKFRPGSLLPSMTAGQWALLIAGFFLVLFAGGLLAYQKIRRRYYLVAR